MTPPVSFDSVLKYPRLQQVIVHAALFLAPLAVGMAKGYSSPALATLSVSDSGGVVTINSYETSWLASSSLGGSVCGLILSGLLLHHSRILQLTTASLLLSVCWWLVASANGVMVVCLLAFFAGACASAIAFVTQIYVHECAPQTRRGTLSGAIKVLTNLGVLTSFSLGPVLNWKQLALVASVAPLIFAVSSLIVPESPRFLLMFDRITEARNSLEVMRGSKVNASADFAEIQQSVRCECSSNSEEKWWHTKYFRQLWKPLFTIAILQVLHKLCGVPVFLYHAVPVLSQLLPLDKAHTFAIVLQLLQLLSGILCVRFSDLLGRVPMLVTSAVLMCGGLAALGFCVFPTSAGDVKPIWAVSCLMLVQISHSVGLGPISNHLVAEMLPIQHRGIGCIALVLGNLSAFASVRSFPRLQLWLGLHGVFWLYSVSAATCALFIIFCVPETNNSEVNRKNETMDNVESNAC